MFHKRRKPRNVQCFITKRSIKPQCFTMDKVYNPTNVFHEYNHWRKPCYIMKLNRNATSLNHISENNALYVDKSYQTKEGDVSCAIHPLLQQGPVHRASSHMSLSRLHSMSPTIASTAAAYTHLHTMVASSASVVVTIIIDGTKHT
jgi:hypothetical protein